MLKGLVINDIHFGIKESKRIYDELFQFKKYLQENKEINFLIINGDYFDCKLSIGDPASFYAVNFFSELIEIVKERDIWFRVVQGTRSHDLNQLQIFKHYEADASLNFRIIENVCEENILGHNILYIPEEYPENAKEYYSEFMAEDKRYDIIFSHTTWNFVALPQQIENAQKSSHSAPVLFLDDWKHTIPNGFISSGHIHGRNIYSNKIYYSGSFSRWSFGERSAKGFTYFETDGENYSVKIINNELAPKFEVFSVKELEIDLDTTEVSVIKEMLDAQIGDSETDHLRIDLNGLSKEKIEILKEHYANRSNVKIEVREDKRTLLKESREAQKEEFEKFKYITKRQLPLNETIKKYCKEELKTDIGLDKINSILKEN